MPVLEPLNFSAQLAGEQALYIYHLSFLAYVEKNV